MTTTVAPPGSDAVLLAVRLELVTDVDPVLAKWGAQRQAPLFAEAFGRDLTLS